MYYEEQCLDGVWWWRSTPDGDWQKFSYQKLQTKLAEVIARATRESEDV